MDNEVAKALHDGLDTLRERGLAKHVLCDDITGRVCSRGAVFLGAYGSPWNFSLSGPVAAADRLLCAVAMEQYPDRISGPYDEIARFNNHPDTTQEDVERIFEKAIVRAYETL